MAAPHVPAGPTGAFTVINGELAARRALGGPVRFVNVVRPLRREPGPDPHFTRALDFKLRRLKEKEILEANLRRPTRFQRRAGTLAASAPDASRQEHPLVEGRMSRSQPQISVTFDDGERARPFPRSDKDFLAKSRSRMPGADGDRPRFVTTVKTGRFLLPPPAVACLLGLDTLYPPHERERIVYSYASKPKAVTTRPKRAICDTKDDRVANGVPPGAPGAPPAKHPRAADAFRGVRALIAGVAGVTHLLERHDHVGSMTTGATGATGYSNLMHDKRVVRGSTIASHPHAAGDGADGAESAAARAARTRRRALQRRAALARLRPGSPPPAPGRRHRPVQTERHLEELFERGVELEIGVQTDLFADRPATPAYVPAKTGADAFTQIQPGDLFDFDLEVQPILEVLVGKTAEQSLAEVAQEEELAALREQQRRYRELRDAELAERQRLAAQDERLHREKERRVAAARAARAAGAAGGARVAAAALVQGYVAELLPAVLAGLRNGGHLLRRLQRGVEEEFMPWLVDEVSLEIESIITSRDVLAEIVRDVVEGRGELFAGAGERLARRGSPPDSPTPPAEPSAPSAGELDE